ncbi:MAG: hypothetical protein J6T18_04785 [Bacteroidaceae bacterium]|nr:hypothetical protein [Bacteroidaceae bacterium]
MRTKINNKRMQVVDLGLRSKWASCNLGAGSQEEYGNYFAWGETEPKNNYEKDNYKLYAEGKTLKYGVEGDCAHVDPSIKKELELKDDAAHIMLGGSWRMPNMNDIKELF